MSRRLLISAQPGETRAAWLDGGNLSDLEILRDDRPWLVDNLYLGRVTARDPGLAAAFVDIGCERPGLLPLDEAPKGLSEGDSVAVRVTRTPQADKGLRLTGCRLPPELRTEAAKLSPPALLRAAQDPFDGLLTAAPPPDAIVIDDPACFAAAKSRLAAHPELRDRLSLDLDPVTPFEREGVEAAIEALLEPQVALASGGHLLVEPVRTLTAIDVNSGTAGRSGMALDVNLEAAAEIPRQLRLRGLAGLIVIDFLELREPAARKRVTEALKDGLKQDPRSSRVQAMRHSGLVEMTLRRQRPALHELLTEPSGLDGLGGLGGLGRVKDPMTCAYEALRAVKRAVLSNPRRQIALAADPRVIAALRGPAAAALAAFEARVGRPLDLRGQAGGESFEIVIE